jgi:hypothetical protein
MLETGLEQQTAQYVPHNQGVLRMPQFEDAPAQAETQPKTAEQLRFEWFRENVETELKILRDGTGKKFGRMVAHFDHTLNRRGIEASPEVKEVYRIKLHCGKPCSLVLVESEEDLRTFTQRCWESDTFIPVIAPKDPEDEPELDYELRKRIFNTFKRGLQQLRRIRRRQHRGATYQRFVNGSQRLFQRHVFQRQPFHNGSGVAA